ncbi:kynureninase-like [Uloborus diversus]|uniref:kynureninase-like n=1 Tax=Uloborus diversus TaxID=327109 RepID=UPI00240975AC|nr:kynureninase-like [Uloborus diversus]
MAINKKLKQNGMPYIPETLSSALHYDFAARAKSWSIEVDSLDYARRLDKDDPLRNFRKLFYYPKKKSFVEGSETVEDENEDCIYFCGHSLGLQLKSIEHNLQSVLQNWADRAVESHFNGDLPAALCDIPLKENMAYLVGAEPDEIAIMNGLTVNIHFMLSTFYQPTEERHKILMVDNGFHSDLYAVQSHIKFRGYDYQKSIVFLKPRPGEQLINPKDIMNVIEQQGKEIALIFMEGVHFYTGQLFDMKNITRAGHKQGCTVGFDLAHAAGNVELHLHDWDVDFGLWCTYKYLNSGAGSMGAIFVHRKHTSENIILPALRGWWGLSNEKKFDLSRTFEPAPGADRFKVSNPSPFLAAMILANLKVFKEAGVDRLLEKQRLLSGYLEYLLMKHFPPVDEEEARRPNIQIITPSNPKRRGCQLSLMSSVPIEIIDDQLKAKGILCDVRKPSVLRVTPVPLYNSYKEVYQFVHTLKEIVSDLPYREGSTK